MKRHFWCVAFAFALGASPVHADVWDNATDHDDCGGCTDNELVHGSIQVHDMAARPGPVADQDWYIVCVPPFSSFEVIVDGMTGDLDLYGVASIQRLSNSTTVVQDATAVSAGGYSRRLAWRNTTANPQSNYVRIQDPACGTGCTSGDQYRITARETTVSVARFNNASSQITVMLSQNASDANVIGSYYFWSAGGTLLGTQTLGLPPKTLGVYNTASFAFLAGAAGHVTIAHDAPYDTLNVKSVALEAATGFSFDTPGVVRSY